MHLTLRFLTLGCARYDDELGSPLFRYHNSRGILIPWYSLFMLVRTGIATKTSLEKSGGGGGRVIYSSAIYGAQHNDFDAGGWYSCAVYGTQRHDFDAGFNSRSRVPNGITPGWGQDRVGSAQPTRTLFGFPVSMEIISRNLNAYKMEDSTDDDGRDNTKDKGTAGTTSDPYLGLGTTSDTFLN